VPGIRLFCAGVVVSLTASWLLVSRLERLGERAGFSEARPALSPASLPQQRSLCCDQRCAARINRIQAIHSRCLHQTSSSGLDQLTADASSSPQRCLVLLVARPGGV
jgi:hypothetical protein